MTLDYSALNKSVTQADIDTYRIVYGGSGFNIPRPIRIAAIVFVSAMVVVLLALILTGYGEAIVALTQMSIAIIMVVAFVKASQKNTKRHAKLYKFALANDASYIVGVANPGYSGLIFNYAKDRSIVEAVVLADGTEIGNYRYVTGNGKNSSEHHWGYVRVKLNRRLPQMILDAKSNNIFGKISNLPNSFRNQSLSLEGDFDKYFTLYVPDNYQQDALYALTPDVMVALIDAGKNYDIEIVDDELYIYGPALDLDLQSSLESMMNVVDKIGDELRDQTSYYKDDRVPDRTTNVVAEPGRRLKKYTSAVKIISTVTVVVLMIYIIVSTNHSHFN